MWSRQERFCLSMSRTLCRSWCLLCLLLLDFASVSAAPWSELAPGLHAAEFSAAQPAPSPALKITIVRIDPARYACKLFCAAENEGQALPLKDWCRQHRLVAVVNAGMYQQDGLTSVGFMQHLRHRNNPYLNSNKSVLVFDPLTPQLPEIQLIDREHQDFALLRPHYASLVQSIRMISAQRKNVWKPQNAKWSTLALGMDDSGKVLLLFCQTPSSVHDCAEALLTLPIEIRSAMYLEGGHQAGLYVATPQRTIELQGVRETDGSTAEALSFAYPIPNVLGFVEK